MNKRASLQGVVNNPHTSCVLYICTTLQRYYAFLHFFLCEIYYKPETYFQGSRWAFTAISDMHII